MLHQRSRSMIFTIALISAAAGVAAFGTASAEASSVDFELGTTGGVRLTDPPLPAYPLHLILDDDTPDGSIGISSGGAAKQFLWFNRFAMPAVEVELAEIWILFPSDPNISVGDSVQLVVYHDPDHDPTNGAALLATYDETIQAADDFTFSVYTLPTPIVISAPGDILVGVVNRFVTSGVTPPTQPAAIDTASSMGRSWLAVWTGDPADPPVLPADDIFDTVDLFQPGNWMIRAFGNRVQAPGVPATGTSGRIMLVATLAALGVWFLRRRS